MLESYIISESERHAEYKRTVCIPVDTSICCEYTISEALKFFLHGMDKVFLLHVVTPKRPYYIQMESKELEAHIKETDLKLSKQLLLNIKDRFILAGLNCTAISLYGDVRETLAEQILEIHPDFVIIGTHGEGKTIGIIGSVSNYLVHHLPIPVTLIKNKAF